MEMVKTEMTYLATADHTFVLIVTKGAFIAYSDEGRGSHIAIANRALAITFVTQSPDRYAWLLAAHD